MASDCVWVSFFKIPQRSGCTETEKEPKHMAVDQDQGYHFGVGAPPILVYFSGDWDVQRGYGILTHGHMEQTLVFTK